MVAVITSNVSQINAAIHFETAPDFVCMSEF